MLTDTVTLMTYQEQLELYPPLKAYLLKPPKLLGPVTVKPWRVYVQRHADQGWAKCDFFTYKDAFHFFKLNRKTYHDISITCIKQGFPPPGKLVKIKRGGQPLMVNTPTGPRQVTRLIPITGPADHDWCIYCRRFTIFTWFSTHHAFTGDMKLVMDPGVERCCICGIRRSTGAYRK